LRTIVGVERDNGGDEREGRNHVSDGQAQRLGG